MPNAYPSALRERAVRAYEAGAGSYEAIAEQYEVSISSLLRWVTQVRTTGDVRPRPRGGGWHSPVDTAVLERVIAEQPDATCEELRRAYNRRVGRAATVSRSAIVRAVHRAGFVLKKNARARARWTVPMSVGSGPRS
jgi:transposase